MTSRSHSHFTECLLAFALVLVMLLSAVPMLAPSAAAEGESIATYVWDGEAAGPSLTVYARDLSGTVHVAIGDSITWGGGPTNPYTWINQMKAVLGGEWHNAGIGSQTTAQMAARFSADVLAHNPDVVYILGGTNDVGEYIPAATIIANLEAMVTAAVNSGADVYLMTIPPRNAPAAMQDIIDDVNAWVMAQGSASVVPVDIYTPLASGNELNPSLAADYVHPNNLGKAVIATTLIKAAQAVGQYSNVHFWDAATSSSASVAASWVWDSAPAAGSSLVFDATSSANCTLDQAVTYGTISVLPGYTGNVTQGSVAVGCAGLTVLSGTVNGVRNYAFTSTGSVSVLGAVNTDLNLVMAGDGTRLTGAVSKVWDLTLAANVTVDTNAALEVQHSLSVTSGVTARFNDTIKFFANNGGTWANGGSIVGSGALEFQTYNAVVDWNPGVVYVPVTIYKSSYAGGSADGTVRLTADAWFYSHLTVYSQTTSYKCILDLNGHYLGVSGTLTIGAYTTVQGAGAVSCQSYLQNGAGSLFTQGGHVTVQAATTMSAGTLTGSTSHTWTTCGFVKTDGTLTNTLNLVLVGGCTYSNTVTDTLYSLRVAGDATFSWNVIVRGISSFQVDEGASLTIADGKRVELRQYTAATYTNLGVINGPGKLMFMTGNAGKTLDLGVVYADVHFTAGPAITSDYSYILSNETIIGGALTVDSESATYTCTLDLNGHSLSAKGVTVGLNGVLVSGNGTVTNYGSLDTSAGTWSFENGAYVQAGDGTIKLGAGQAFHDLTVEDGVTATLGSDVTVTGLPLIYGTVDKAGYTLTAASPELTATPSEDATEDALYAYSAASTQPGEWSIATNAPWLTIDGTSVSGTPSNGDVGEWWLSVTITNDATGTATTNVTITVANVAPEWTHQYTPPSEAGYGDPYYFDLSTSDEWDGLTYSLETNSPDLRIWLDGGVVEGTLNDVLPLIYVNVTADDGNGGVIYCNWTITVHALGDNLRFEIVHEASTVDPLRIFMSYRLLDGTNDTWVQKVWWNFGDGLGSYDLAPVHQYSQEAEYTVTCAIYDVWGGITHRSIILTVGDPENPMGPQEKLAIWLQTGFWALIGLCIVGLSAMYVYVIFAKKRGGVNPFIVGAAAVGLAVALLTMGGYVIW